MVIVSYEDDKIRQPATHVPLREFLGYKVSCVLLVTCVASPTHVCRTHLARNTRAGQVTPGNALPEGLPRIINFHQI